MSCKVDAAAVLDLGLWSSGSLDGSRVRGSGYTSRDALGRVVIVLDGPGGWMMGQGRARCTRGHGTGLFLEAALAKHVVLLLCHRSHRSSVTLLAGNPLVTARRSSCGYRIALVGHSVFSAIEKYV